MRQSDVMVYLMTGFLDSGKTQFLTFTLEQDYFQIQGKTLLILCEEGEEEYDPKEMLKYGVVIDCCVRGNSIVTGSYVRS